MTRTFVDTQGVSHEALATDHWVLEVVSLCGRQRDPVLIDDKAFHSLCAYVLRVAPEGVDCMTCLVRRAQLERMFDDEPESLVLKLALRVTP